MLPCSFPIGSRFHVFALCGQRQAQASILTPFSCVEVLHDGFRGRAALASLAFSVAVSQDV